MSARRRRSARTRLRGAWFAFLALAMQVLVPFFMAVEIARAEAPGAASIICSAAGHDIHQGGGTTHQGVADHCSLCITLAAAHGFESPAAPPLPLPAAVDGSDLSAADVAQAALIFTSSHRSRGPPSSA